MCLNTDAVNNTCPIHAEAMRVATSQQENPNQFPFDIIPNILRHLPAIEIFNLALVCSDWKAIVESQSFQNSIILPPNFNGPQRWKELTKGDVGEAPALPRKIFKCMQSDKYMLTYIPETVKIKNEDGTESVVPLNSLENVGKLFAHTLNGRNIGFDPDSFPNFMQEVKTLEKGHWILISKKAMGKGLDYLRQVGKANEMGAIMPGSIETVTSLFMEYLRTEEKHPLDEIGKSIFIRVDDKIRRLWLGFSSSGIRVDYFDYDFACPDLAFAPARKTFG